MFLTEPRNKPIRFYTKFSVKQVSSIFDVLMYEFSAAQQTSTAKLPERSKG